MGLASSADTPDHSTASTESKHWFWGALAEPKTRPARGRVGKVAPKSKSCRAAADRARAKAGGTRAKQGSGRKSPAAFDAAIFACGAVATSTSAV